MMDDGEYHSCKFCRTQALRVEERDERIRQLERELYNREWDPPAELRLSRMEADIVRTLVRRDQVISKEMLIEATRGQYACKSDPEPKLMDTMVCKLRAKLKPFGLVIETVWGRGFRLEPASRERLNNWTPPHERAA